jgi:chemotaxis response regulator CheB
MKVVIVDDSVEIRERLTAMLGEIPGVEIAGQAATVAETMSAGMQVDPSRAVV